MIKKTAVIGGDMRQQMLSRLLKRDGYEVGIYGMDDSASDMPPKIQSGGELSQFDALILPMPVTTDGININAPDSGRNIPLDEVMHSIPCTTVVLGGKLPSSLVEKYKQIRFYDYLEREDFAVKNSVATAEGAVAIAINETPRTIWNSRCLVTGFGRISKSLVRMLTALGARVDVCARKCSDRAWCETLFCGAFDFPELGARIGGYSLIFNTIPDIVINADVLKNVSRDALIIDLASKPGGVDFAAARLLGANVIWALSLPGKVAPYTSGEILKDTIENIFKELAE